MTNDNIEKTFIAIIQEHIQDHKILSILDKIKGCDDYGEECVFKIGLREFVICPKCGKYKK